jgi:DNA-binding NarL/FixJ family response regulator
MGGEQTIRELLKIDPHVKAIVSSGYPNDPVIADFRSYGFRGTIPKPYRKMDLEKALKRI